VKTSAVKRLLAKYPFHPLVWYIIFETALSRIAFFMAMPFVAIRMHDASGSSAVVIGAVIGVAPLAATFAGFWVGHWSDRFGRRNIIISTLFFWSVVLLGFSFATSPIEFALLMGLNGLARGVFEPLTTALISDLCSLDRRTPDLQKRAFHFRYFAINVGSSIGPLLGASVLLKSPVLGFQVASAVWFVSGILFWQLSRRWGVKTSEAAIAKAEHRMRDALAVFARDRVLQIYLLAHLLMSFSYSQIESIFAIHLKELYGGEGVLLFGRLLTLNGITVVLITLPLLTWTKK